MSKAVARVGDPCTHGATITEGSSSRFANGKAVARLGDKVTCPQHGQTTIVSDCSTTSFADNKAVAVVGSKCACGAVVTAGSPDTFA